MNGLLEVVGVEVGKHLGDVSNLLPLRCVCKEWREVATLGAVEATLDLEPRLKEPSNSSSKKEQLFFKACPRLQKLTYHVSPWVSLAQFEVTMRTLSARLTNLQELVLIFSNPAQQLETRHLASLAALPALSSLTLQASFHPESCNFSAALGPCSGLSKFVVLPHEACKGLTDSHVASLAGLRSLETLEFAGHARSFSGASLSVLAVSLPCLSRLVISSNKPGAVDYTLALPALAGLRAFTRRSGSSCKPLTLEVGVPDAAFAAALLRAVAGPGLRTVSVSVREAADSASIAALTAAPGTAQQLAGLDLEFKAAPTAEDVAVLAACGSLKRLHVSCKCPRAPAGALDWTPWLALRSLEHLHLHVNPAWRAPLQPSAVAAMAAAWPRLTHLHLRLSPSDNATHALQQLGQFKSLKYLSLTWLGQAAAAGAGHAANRGRRGSSLESAAFHLAHLPEDLEELHLTSISSVRLGLPPPPCVQQQQPGPAVAVPFAPPRPFVYLVPAAPTAPVLPSLKALVLDGNFGVSDDVLLGLLAHAPQLSSLNLVLAGRQTLTGYGLHAALSVAATAATAGGGVYKGLSSLSFCDYREPPLCLSQASLAGISGILSRLRHLKLSTPDIVHHELLPHVYTGFTKLRRLDLVGCQDQAADALGPALPLCCIKTGHEWLGDGPAAVAAAAAAAEAAAGAAGAPATAVAAAPAVEVAA